MALPPAYLELLAEMKAQHERYAAIANRILDSGIGDTQLLVEDAKMREIDGRLQALRMKLGLIECVSARPCPPVSVSARQPDASLWHFDQNAVQTREKCRDMLRPLPRFRQEPEASGEIAAARRGRTPLIC